MSATIDKIRKLLNLAKNPSASANEAEVAATLAAQLMEAADLDASDVGDTDAPDPASTVRAEHGDREASAGWYWTAATAVARIVGCYTYRDAQRINGKIVYTRVWIGTAEQREKCRELYPWVVRQIERLSNGAHEIAKRQARPRAFLNAYRLGVANAIARKACEISAYRKQAPATSTALERVSRIEEAIEKCKPEGLRVVHAHYSERTGFVSGQSAGGSVQLQQQAGGSTIKRLRSGSC